MDGKYLFSAHLLFNPEKTMNKIELEGGKVEFKYTKIDYDHQWHSEKTRYAAAINLPKYVVVIVEELPKVEPTTSPQGIYFVIRSLY